MDDALRVSKRLPASPAASWDVNPATSDIEIIGVESLIMDLRQKRGETGRKKRKACVFIPGGQLSGSM